MRTSFPRLDYATMFIFGGMFPSRHLLEIMLHCIIITALHDKHHNASALAAQSACEACASHYPTLIPMLEHLYMTNASGHLLPERTQLVLGAGFKPVAV